MKLTPSPTLEWSQLLQDPSGKRLHKPRLNGLTMVMDKGLGMHAFEDMITTSHEHIDVIKLGFGTSVIVPRAVIEAKIALAKAHNIYIMPGGTLLEIAFVKGVMHEFFQTIRAIGFNSIEVSDGTISLSRKERNQLIQEAISYGLHVSTEYGKKLEHSEFVLDQLAETYLEDLANGAAWMTLEGRESGAGVGIYNQQGNCDERLIEDILACIPYPEQLMWEAPNKKQQLSIIKRAGTNANLGNVAPSDIIALEALRRGLRSDTMIDHVAYYYDI